MQTLKSRPSSLDVLTKPCLDTSNAARKLKIPGSDSDSLSSSNTIRRTPRDRSPKVTDRKSPRAVPTEKQRTGNVSELETRITELEDELRKTKDQLSLSESWKRRAQQVADDTKKQLAAKITELEDTRRELNDLSECEEALKSEYANATIAYNSVLMELAQSENRVISLEEHVGNLQAILNRQSNMLSDPNVETKTSFVNDDRNESGLKSELDNLQTEVTRLKIALQASEKRYQQERDTLETQNTYGLVERRKSESTQRESELEAKLKECMAEVNELRTKMVEKENLLQKVILKHEKDSQPSDEKTETAVKKSDSAMEVLKASLLDTEARLQNIIEENEKLKSEIVGNEIERNKAHEEAISLARVAEQKTLVKLGSLTEEADRSCKNTALISEQLDAAQVANSVLEAELRKLKVQADQWKKAAEAAAAMLSTSKNGKNLQTTGSLEFHRTGSKLSPSYLDDTDGESPKKKNGSMLKKIGTLLKKGQK